MSLIYKRLSAQSAITSPVSSQRVPVLTASGLQNLELGTLQNFINAPVLQLISEIEGGGGGPSIWPIERTITMGGALTGAVALDGSEDVTFNVTIPDASIDTSKISGLNTTLIGLQNQINGKVSAEYPTLIGPVTIRVDADQWLQQFYSADGTTSRGGVRVNADNSLGVVNSRVGQWRELRFEYNGDLTYGDGVTQNTVWHAGNFDPATKLNTSGTAASATQLATQRSFSLTGVITAPAVNFNGTGNVALATSIADGALSQAKVSGLSAALAATVSDKGVLAGSVNLNTITDAGVYFQNSNTDAASGTNYPVALAGKLEVHRNGAMTYQHYHLYNNGDTWTRAFYDTAWSPWVKTWHSSNFDPTTKANTSHTHAAGDITAGVLNAYRVSYGQLTDTRAVDDQPGAGGLSRTWRWDFKESSTGGNFGGGTFAAVLGITQWSDDSGGGDHQLAFIGGSGGVMKYRYGTRAGGWGGWRTMWDSANFDPTNPVPTGGVLQVGSSSGSFIRLRFDNTISINGGAWNQIYHSGNMDTANFVRVNQEPLSAFADPNGMGGTLSHCLVGTPIGNGPREYSTVWNLPAVGGRDGQFGWFYGTGQPQLFFRSRHDSNGTWNPWVTIWHTGNFDPATKLTARSSLNTFAENIADWNSASSAGWYMGAGIANQPVADGNWYIGIVSQHNSDWIQQEAWTFTAGAATKRYRRHKLGGTWGAWTADANFDVVGTDRLFAGWDSGVSGAISCNNWFRATNNTGLYFAEHGIGVYATDGTYVRAYNGAQMAAADFVITSDERLKTNIVPFKYQGRLRPVSFQYTADARHDFGFIAQDVQKLYPDAVGMLDGYLQLSYPKLTAVLAHQVNAVEDKQAEQEQEIQALRDEVAELKQLVQQLLAAKSSS